MRWHDSLGRKQINLALVHIHVRARISKNAAWFCKLLNVNPVLCEVFALGVYFYMENFIDWYK